MLGRHKQSGFTLVELSIVIVIIALIVSGIVAGQSLVKSAKIRAIVTEADKYKASINTFYLEYNALPGDIPNATSYWSGVLDGDGDKYVHGAPAGGATEGSYFWEHLLKAGLVSGGYTGVAIPNTEIPGVHTGISSFSNKAGFIPFTLGIDGNYWNYGSNLIYGKRNVSVLGFGAVHTGDNKVNDYSILTPKEAFGIDKKFDDGIPSAGLILGDHGTDLSSPYNCTNVTNAFADTGATSRTYDVSTTTAVQCRIMFVLPK